MGVVGLRLTVFCYFRSIFGFISNFLNGGKKAEIDDALENVCSHQVVRWGVLEDFQF